MFVSVVDIIKLIPSNYLHSFMLYISNDTFLFQGQMGGISGQVGPLDSNYGVPQSTDVGLVQHEIK